MKLQVFDKMMQLGRKGSFGVFFANDGTEISNKEMLGVAFEIASAYDHAIKQVPENQQKRISGEFANFLQDSSSIDKKSPYYAEMIQTAKDYKHGQMNMFFAKYAREFSANDIKSLGFELSSAYEELLRNMDPKDKEKSISDLVWFLDVVFQHPDRVEIKPTEYIAKGGETTSAEEDLVKEDKTKSGIE